MFDELLADRAFQVALRGSLAVLLVLGVVLLLQRAWPIVEPLLIASILALALWPWVSRLSSLPIGPRHWRMPRLLSAGLIYLGTFLTAGLLVWQTLLVLLPQLDQVLASYPEQTAPLRAYLEPFRAGDMASGARRVAETVAREATQAESQPQQAEPAPAQPVDVGRLGIGLFGGLLTLGLVLVFTFFLLLEGDRFAQWLVLLLPKSHRPQVRQLGLRIRDRISRWVLAQLVYAAVSGLIVGSAMWALGLPTPWLYGIAGALLAALPGVGPALAAIPALFVAAGLSTWQLVGVALFAVVLYVVDATTISTKIYGEMLRLPMFVILLAVFFGAVLMGVWGALIAAPVAAGLQSILQEQLHPDAEPVNT